MLCSRNNSMNNNTNLKITMLGGSGSGKTCFMLAMYNIMSSGVDGFTFSTDDWDDGIDLEEAWYKLYDGTAIDRWPKGTADSRSYKFALNYGAKRLQTFEWLDYRGGALIGRSDDSGLGTLKAHLAGSYGVFIVVPCDILIQNDTRAGHRMHISRIVQLLTETSNSGNQPVVSLVITKVDIWTNKFGRGQQEKLINQLRELFNPLFAKGGNWTVTIIPVTLGEDLCNNPDSAQIAPNAIHLPVTFTISELYNGKKDAIQNSKQALAVIPPCKVPWWEKMFGSNDISRLEIDSKNQKSTNEENAIESVRRIISGIMKAEVPVYKDGERVRN